MSLELNESGKREMEKINLRRFGKVLRVLGMIYIYAAGALIILCSLMVLVKQGFWKFIWLFSPWNIVNYAVMFATLFPGIALVLLGRHLEERK